MAKVESQLPILYYNARSAPCRAVLLTAGALNVELDLREMNLKDGDHMTPEFLSLNPQHTIPVLDDNGKIIVDSHVICTYIADKFFRDHFFYPKDEAKRRFVNTLLHYNCGHLFPRLRFMLEPVIYFGADTIPRDRIDYMQKAYDGLERYLEQTQYLCGEHITVADLCCVATVSTSMFFSAVDARKFPKVQAWVDRLSRLPYYFRSNQDGANTLVKFIQNQLIENKNAKEEVRV